MLGLVIFGWPKKEKVVGTASPGFCDHCQNQSGWIYGKTRRWLSLFFVPLLPLERATHYLVCDICGAAIELDREEAKAAKEMVGTTEEWSGGALSDGEYLAAVEGFEGMLAPGEPDGELDINASETEVADTRYIQ